MKEIFLDALHNRSANIIEYIKFNDISIKDERGASLLHYAARSNSIDIAMILLENYIDPNMQDNNGDTALTIATSYGLVGFAKILLRFGANPLISNKAGMSPLFYAYKKGSNEITELFSDIDLNYKNDLGENVLFMAIKGNQKAPLISLLSQNPQGLKMRDNAGNTLLHHAIKANDLSIVQLLVERGISIHAKNKERYTAIFLACQYASCEIVIYLLKHLPIIEGETIFLERIEDLSDLNPFNLGDIIINYRSSSKYLHYLENFPYCVAVIAADYDKISTAKPEDLKKSDVFNLTPLDYAKIVSDDKLNRILRGHQNHNHTE